MNLALIIAGGYGKRMKNDVPKQFLNVYDKPVIIYTLEAFQMHPEIDAIGVVCIDGWHEILKAYARQEKISKLKWIVSGGECGQESIYNGIMEAKKYCKNNDIILVHDAIRPMVSQEIISDAIIKCNTYGSAVAAISCTTAVLEYNNHNNNESSKIVDRGKLAMTQTPQAFSLGKLIWAHEEARKKNINESVASCTLMIELGEKVHFSLGSETNIKLTTQGDLEIFKALLYAKKRSSF